MNHGAVTATLTTRWQLWLTTWGCKPAWACSLPLPPSVASAHTETNTEAHQQQVKISRYLPLKWLPTLLKRTLMGSLLVFFLCTHQELPSKFFVLFLTVLTIKAFLSYLIWHWDSRMYDHWVDQCIRAELYQLLTPKHQFSGNGNAQFANGLGDSWLFPSKPSSQI